ncbi:hypothetical protein HAX54_038401, partial [Datura stramonium]|nr:hypothetical protein [Datura stramonium]
MFSGKIQGGDGIAWWYRDVFNPTSKLRAMQIQVPTSKLPTKVQVRKNIGKERVVDFFAGSNDVIYYRNRKPSTCLILNLHIRRWKRFKKAIHCGISSDDDVRNRDMTVVSNQSKIESSHTLLESISGGEVGERDKGIAP